MRSDTFVAEDSLKKPLIANVSDILWKVFLDCICQRHFLEHLDTAHEFHARFHPQLGSGFHIIVLSSASQPIIQVSQSSTLDKPEKQLRFMVNLQIDDQRNTTYMYDTAQ